MSGLLTLLDDVATIAKVAAVSVDDIAAAATKAGAKAAGAVIDDSAVTPKYVHGFSCRRGLVLGLALIPLARLVQPKLGTAIKTTVQCGTAPPSPVQLRASCGRTMPRPGVEPGNPCEWGILSPLRLPIPPSGLRAYTHSDRVH